MFSLTSYSRFEEAIGDLVGVQVGTSVCGYPLLLFRKSGAKKRLLVIGGVHAREEITVQLLLALFREHADPEIGVDCLPLANPDGVFLAAGGPGALPLNESQVKTLLRFNGNHRDFSLWKANIRGVDLNVNFNAAWGEGFGNLTHPASAGYIGEYPYSEPETRAMATLIHSMVYDGLLCYHARGEVVYYGFHGRQYEELAKKLGARLGYRAMTTPMSAGGAKDDFLLKTGKPGFTIEVGEDWRDYHDYGGFGALLARHSGSWSFFGREL